MIGGTSGSEAKLCQPFSSQSKTTQTRSFSLGSRNTVAPLHPYCFRFSKLLVEKIFRKRSKSSTLVVASNISLSFECALLEKIDPAALTAPMAAAVFISERRESQAARRLSSVD